MKKAIITKILVAVIGLVPALALADSPLTSTSFSDAYVKRCQQGSEDSNLCRGLNQRNMNGLVRYLSNDKVRLDNKLAIVNSFGISDAKNSFAFKNSVGKLSAEDRIVLAYMIAMENYLDNNSLRTALGIASGAASELRSSFSAQLVVTLIKAQLTMHSGNWKDVWHSYESLLKNYSVNKRDMLPEAVEIITDYMKLYKR